LTIKNSDSDSNPELDTAKGVSLRTVTACAGAPYKTGVSSVPGGSRKGAQF